MLVQVQGGLTLDSNNTYGGYYVYQWASFIISMTVLRNDNRHSILVLFVA
jgi:hypothetical protein